VRLEELTRMGSDVQDTLITVLSEKTLPVPELDLAIDAAPGFNVIATANNRDKGVNDLFVCSQTPLQRHCPAISCVPRRGDRDRP